MRAMPGSVQFGVAWGLLLLLLLILLPAPRALGAYLLATAALSAWMAVIALSKGRLVGMGVGLALGTLACGVFGGLLFTRDEFPPGGTTLLFVGAVVVAVMLARADSKLDRDAWRALGERVSTASLLDLLLGRHLYARKPLR